MHKKDKIQLPKAGFPGKTISSFFLTEFFFQKQKLLPFQDKYIPYKFWQSKC